MIMLATNLILTLIINSKNDDLFFALIGTGRRTNERTMILMIIKQKKKSFVYNNFIINNIMSLLVRTLFQTQSKKKHLPY